MRRLSLLAGLTLSACADGPQATRDRAALLACQDLIRATLYRPETAAFAPLDSVIFTPASAGVDFRIDTYFTVAAGTEGERLTGSVACDMRLAKGDAAEEPASWSGEIVPEDLRTRIGR